jgi:hypothetical protein
VINTREDLNYLGQLYLIGANQTPLLNMMGGLAGGGGKTCKGFTFATAQPWSLGSAAQTVVSEANSTTAPAATTYTRGQDTNTIQIMQRTYEVTYAKQSATGEIGAITAVSGSTSGENPVTDEIAFQRTGAMLQLAKDIEYSFFQGSEVAVTDATTEMKTQGFANAISTNTVAAGSIDLSKVLINNLLRTMAGNGSQFMNPVMFVNAFQKQQITDIYGYAPEDRNVGGLNIKQIETDFAMLGIVYAPQMPTSSLFVIDMSVVAPMYCPAGGQLIIDEQLAKVGATNKYQLYTQVGLDFGAEEYHGKITGLSIS